MPATVVVVQRRYPAQVWGEVPGLKGKCHGSRAHAAALQAYEPLTLQVRSDCDAVAHHRDHSSKSLQLLSKGAGPDCPRLLGVPCQGADVSLAGDLAVQYSPRCGIVETFKSMLQKVNCAQAKTRRR